MSYLQFMENQIENLQGKKREEGIEQVQSFSMGIQT